MRWAPIAVFAYKRPQHLQQLLQSLEANPQINESEIYFFIDGPKSNSDRTAINEVIEIAKAFSLSLTKHVVIQEKNLGLANSVINGVGHVLSQHSSVIVLEDDLRLSPFFLEFMNRHLQKYASEASVGAIQGYTYPLGRELQENYFLRGADCWGWATWGRAWRLFEADGQKLFDQLKSKNLMKDFDLGGSYDYRGMLLDQMTGRTDSWAVRWHASLFSQNKLSLYPAQSLVQNEGFDSSGTHCEDGVDFQVKMANTLPMTNPSKVQESQKVLKLLKNFYWQKMPWWKKWIPYSIYTMLRDFRRWRRYNEDLRKKEKSA